MENGIRLFKQMKDSLKVDIEHLREFRKGVGNARSLNPEKRKKF